MFIFPIGQERGRVRRLPVLSLLLIVVNTFVFLLTYERSGEQMEAAVMAALEFYSENTYLQFSPELKAELDGELLAMVEQESDEEWTAGSVPTGEPLRAAQLKLDGLCAKAVTLLHQSYVRRYGHVPARGGILTLFTSQFLHGGWMHLASNMLVFFFIAPFIEDVYGRPMFIGFYLIGGAVAALSHCVLFPNSTSHLIGASGAIAALMGAFLFRFHDAKLQFVYFTWVLKVYYGRFRAPAYLVLPLWVVEQIAEATLMGRSAGVAYWAHIGGFIFGVGAAFGIHRMRFEERFVWSTIDGTTATGIAHPALARAEELQGSGKKQAARKLLEAAAIKSPQDAELQLALFRINLDLADRERARRHAVQGIAQAVRTGQVDVALAALDHATAENLPLDCQPTVLMAVARRVQQLGDPERAIQMYESIATRAANLAAAKALSAASEVVLTLGRPSDAAAMLTRALAVPQIDRTLKLELEQRLQEIPAKDRQAAAKAPARLPPPVQTLPPKKPIPPRLPPV